MGVVGTEEKKETAPTAAAEKPIEGDFKEQPANGETAVALREETAMGLNVVDPEKAIADARKLANALMQVIAGKPKKVVIRGEQYLEIEDWSFLGEVRGVAGKTDWTRPFVQENRRVGWESRAIVVDLRTGIEVGSAEAMCLETEEEWGKRPEIKWLDEDVAKRDFKPEQIKEIVPSKYRNGKPRAKVIVGYEDVSDQARRSMAQTRAVSKALAQRLRFIPMLAGLKGTPAEEMKTYQSARDYGNPYPGEEEALLPKDAAPAQAEQRAQGEGPAGVRPVHPTAAPAPAPAPAPAAAMDVKPWTDDEHSLVVSTYKAILQFKKDGHVRAAGVLSAFGDFMAKHRLDWTGQRGKVSLWSRPDLREQVYKILELDVPLPKPAAAAPAFDPDAVPE